MPALLDIRGLSVHYPTAAGVARAVDGVDLTVGAGRTLGLVGESGCGKTSVALAIPRLLPAAAKVTGSILFDGSPLLDLPERELRAVRGGGVGVVFQDPGASFDPLFSLGNQIAETVRWHRQASRRSSWAEALDLLRSVRMPDFERVARQYPHQVSGGMLQRAAIAAALAGRPRLLIADEPTTALDVTVQAEILELMRQLRAERGLALLWITHDLDVVAALADEVAVMYAGKIVEAGPGRAVFNDPRHPYTQSLLRCRPRLGETGRLATIDGVVPAATAWPQGCRFRDRCQHRSEICLREPRPEATPAGGVVTCWNWRAIGAPAGS